MSDRRGAAFRFQIVRLWPVGVGQQSFDPRFPRCWRRWLWRSWLKRRATTLGHDDFPTLAVLRLRRVSFASWCLADATLLSEHVRFVERLRLTLSQTHAQDIPGDLSSLGTCTVHHAAEQATDR